VILVNVLLKNFRHYKVDFFIKVDTLNWTGRFSRYFVYNGKLTSLLLITLFVGGLFSFFQTPKKYNPTIVAPAFQITIDYPGSTRSEILEQITKPLERVLTDIPGVEDVFSVSLKGGRVIVTVNFFVGEDLDASKVALNDRLQSDGDLAPLGLPTPNVKTLDPEDIPVLVLAVESERLGAIELRKFGFRLRDLLSSFEGVSRIQVIGGRKRELSIQIDPKKLAKYAISLKHIEDTLKQNNIYLPSGLIKGPFDYSPIEVNGLVSSPEEIANIVIISSDSVRIKLKDFAVVEEQVNEIEDYVRHLRKKEGKVFIEEDIVLVSLAKLKGTNIGEVTNGVNQRISELMDRHVIPSHIKVRTIIDEGKKADNEIKGLIGNLLTSILIVVIVLFLFLNMRAALLVAIAIPLTLASVFGVALWAGQDINRITLFALILSLGLLVDNATVVVENIVRHRLKGSKGGNDENNKDDNGDNGHKEKEEVVQAVNEVGPGLVMSTITTVIAFIPMAFVTGMMGPYMGPIPFFVPAALILSLLIGLSINPWLASVLLKNPGKEKKSKWGNAFIEWYQRSLSRLLHSKKASRLTLLAILGLLIFTCAFPLFKWVRFRMLPKADVNQVFLYLDLPQGISLDQNLKITQSFEKKMMEDPYIEMIQSYVGRAPILDFNGLFRGVSERKYFNQSTLRLGIRSKGSREITSEALVWKWRPLLVQHAKELTIKLKLKHPIKIKVVEDPPGPPVLSTLLVRVQAEREELIERETKAFLEEVKKVKGVVDYDISIPTDFETIELEVNHFEASKVKITPAQIVETLRIIYSGKVIGIYHKEDNREQEYISLRFKKTDRMSEDFLDQIFLRNPLRISVPLKRLVKVKRSLTQHPLFRENHGNTSYIYGELEKRSITYAGIDLLLKLYDYKLSNGEAKRVDYNFFGATYLTDLGEEIKITLGGEWELTIEVFRDLMLAMGIAIIVIYFVLVAQFSSFGEPFIIMSTIPLSVLGVFPGFAILFHTSNEYFTATSMIGIIALAGIAVNNSIILLEYLNLLKREGQGLIEALINASVTRLRPIALTTITTVLGSMTILGDPVWAGLAWAIVLGLGTSSTLILLVFPLLYKELMGRYWTQK
jgi:multidrug efflux pump subunit AcrB